MKFLLAALIAATASTTRGAIIENVFGETTYLYKQTSRGITLSSCGLNLPLPHLDITQCKETKHEPLSPADFKEATLLWTSDDLREIETEIQQSKGKIEEWEKELETVDKTILRLVKENRSNVASGFYLTRKKQLEEDLHKARPTLAFLYEEKEALATLFGPDGLVQSEVLHKIDRHKKTYASVRRFIPKIRMAIWHQANSTEAISRAARDEFDRLKQAGAIPYCALGKTGISAEKKHSAFYENSPAMTRVFVAALLPGLRTRSEAQASCASLGMSLAGAMDTAAGDASRHQLGSGGPIVLRSSVSVKEFARSALGRALSEFDYGGSRQKIFWVDSAYPHESKAFFLSPDGETFHFLLRSEPNSNASAHWRLNTVCQKKISSTPGWVGKEAIACPR